MNDSESGFSTPLAMTVIFSLSLITLSLAMFVSANGKKIDTYRKSVEAEKEAETILLTIEASLQGLKEYRKDADTYHAESLISGVCDCDFSVKDVSTGINKNFLSEKILKNDAFRRYISENGDAVFSEYGWVNPAFSDKKIIAEIEQNFECKSPFPLINSFPPMNIHFMSADFIRAVLDFYNINGSERKAMLIREKLNSDTDAEELAHILGIRENHALFDFIGFKTLFWEVSFDTGKCRCHAVFAAVPEKYDQKRIEKYILVEKNVSLKGGIL